MNKEPEPLTITIKGDDHELGILAQLIPLLAALDRDRQQRVLEYLTARFVTDQKQSDQ